MRALLSLAGLLVALLIVFQLTRQAAVTPSAGVAASAPHAARQVADDVRKAITQGAEARASEAALQ